MKHKARRRIYDATKVMTDAELIKYFGRSSCIFRETGKIPAVESGRLVLREGATKFGESPDAKKS